MPRLDGSTLHHTVACRIVGSYLGATGALDVRTPAIPAGESDGVDITLLRDGRKSGLKVKADSYFGTDPVKIADRNLPFYRRQGADYAFEAVSDSVTRRPGWMFHSEASHLYYYFLALGQPEAEVAALLGEPDEVFFGELKADRDELHVIPMDALQEWFEAHYEQYTPRPVLVGDHSAWYRLVPRDVLRSSVPIEVLGPVFDVAARASR
jgi:hypothetical protein